MTCPDCNTRPNRNGRCDCTRKRGAKYGDGPALIDDTMRQLMADALTQLHATHRR